MSAAMLTLPPEILGNIVCFLNGFQVATLLESHPRFHLLLIAKGNLPSFCWNNDIASKTGPQKILAWFGGHELRSLTLINHHHPDFLTESWVHLRHLSPSLTNLNIEGPTALTMWHDATPNSTVLQLDQLLPNLTSLRLMSESWGSLMSGTVGYKRTARWTNEMKRTFLAHLSLPLRSLELSHYDDLPSNMFLRLKYLEQLTILRGTFVIRRNIFPDSFKALKTRGLPQVEFESLPPSLETLNIVSNASNMEPILFRLFPRGLKSLSMPRLFLNGTPAELPPSLTSFTVSDFSYIPPDQYDTFFPSLPVTIKRLQLRQTFLSLTSSLFSVPPHLTCLILEHCSLSIKMLTVLPHSMTDLATLIKHQPSSEAVSTVLKLEHAHAVSMAARALNNLPTTKFSVFPPHLTRLSVATGLPTRYLMKLLPPTLTQLGLPSGAIPWVSLGDSVSYLPPKLTALYIGSQVSDDAVVKLPKSITAFSANVVRVCGHLLLQDHPSSLLTVDSSIQAAYRYWKHRFVTYFPDWNSEQNATPIWTFELNLLPTHCRRVDVDGRVPPQIRDTVLILPFALSNAAVLEDVTAYQLGNTERTPLLNFPASLTRLDIFHDHVLTRSNIHVLPDTLIELSVRNSRLLGSFAPFKEGLRILKLPRATWQLGFRPHRPHHIPTSLTHLVLARAYVNHSFIFPPQLVTLECRLLDQRALREKASSSPPPLIPLHECMGRWLPSGLTSLRIGVHATISPALLQSLPRSLKGLTLRSSDKDVNIHLMRQYLPDNVIL